MILPTDHVLAVERAPLDRPEIDATVTLTGLITGLDVRGAELLKFTNNAVLRLPRARVVLRIAGSEAVGARADRVVRAARLLQDRDVPAVRLWPGCPGQPVVVRGHEVTIWDDVRELRRPVPGDLAALLLRLHAVPPRRLGLPSWDPVAGIRRRIAAADPVATEALGFLTHLCAEVAEGLTGLDGVEPVLGSGLIHGDAFLGNVIAGAQGPVLCDFDSTCRGPREWDLTPVAVGAWRFGGVGRHLELAARYGVDITAWGGFTALRRLRELQLVTSVLPVLGANPALVPQWRLRVESLRAHDDTARWTPYADVA